MFNFVFNGNDTIPVFKLFVSDYMPGLDGNDVKVYLYGLYLASEKQAASSESIAEALDLSVENVEKAVARLVKAGLMERKGDIYSFAVPKKSIGTDEPIYSEKKYLDVLSGIMDGRQFNSNEISTLIDFKDILKLPEEVIFMLVEYVSSPAVKGKRVSMRYIEKVALGWAEDNIRTVKKAQAEINRHSALSSGALRVINALYGGNRRLPNEAELELYRKWTKELGFTHDGIMQAVSEASLVQDPSMKYLDVLIMNLYERGITTTSDIVAEKEQKNRRREELKEVLDALKSPRKSASTLLQTYYEDWVNMGFSQVAILCACEYTLNSGYHSYKKVNELLRFCYSKGIVSNRDVAERLKFRSDIDKNIHQIMEIAGLQGNITERERKIYYVATEQFGMPLELIMLAADLSSTKKDPMSYMYSVLKFWAEAGIMTVQAAKKAVNPSRAPRPQTVENDIKKRIEDHGDEIYG